MAGIVADPTAAIQNTLAMQQPQQDNIEGGGSMGPLDSGASSGLTPTTPNYPALAAVFPYANNQFLTAGDVNSQMGQNLIAALGKYGAGGDVQNSGINSIEGGSGADWNTMNIDKSKLPGPKGIGNLADPTTWGMGIKDKNIGFTGAFGNMKLINPNETFDSSLYGKMTPSSNVYQDPGNGLMSFADKILPYAVMSVLGYGAGVAGTSLLGAAGIDGALGSGLGKTLGNFGLQEAMTGGQAKLNPLSIAGDFAGAIPGVGDAISSSGIGQVMPYLHVAQLFASARQGNPMAIFQLAKMGYSGFGGK